MSIATIAISMDIIPGTACCQEVQGSSLIMETVKKMAKERIAQYYKKREDIGLTEDTIKRIAKEMIAQWTFCFPQYR